MDITQDYSIQMFLWSSVLFGLGLIPLSGLLGLLYGFIFRWIRTTAYTIKSGSQILLIVMSTITIGLYIYVAFSLSNTINYLTIEQIWTLKLITEFGGIVIMALIINLFFGIITLALSTFIIAGVKKIIRI